MSHFRVIVFICITFHLFSSGECVKAWESIYTFPKDKVMTGIKVARDECAKLGHSYDLPDDQTHRELLRQAVKDKGVAPVWLAVKKTDLAGWTWVNGTKAKDASIRDSPNAAEMCGAVSLQESNIVASNCNDDRNGFVCEIRGSRGCTLDHFTQACIQVDTKSYIIGCKIGSWFKARQFCQQYEADLATVDSSATLQKILKYITDGKYGGVCSWLFIGLSKEDWQIHKTSGITIPRFVNWTAGEPRQDSSLTQLAFSGDTYSWKSARSDLTAAIICQDYSKHSALIPIPQQRGELQCPDSPECKPTGSTGSPVWLVVVVGVCCLCLTGVPLAVLLVWHFWKRSPSTTKIAQKDESISGETQKQGVQVQENEPLLPPLKTSEQKDAEEEVNVKKEISGKISVAIFSENVKNVEVYDKALLKPERNAEEDIICQKYYEIANEGNATPLKIVKVPLANKDDKKNTEYAKDLLREVLDFGVDVVLLPGMDPSKDEELMKMLHELRSKSVLVCPGDIDTNEFPACETICVGIYSTSNQITTGILDFWVSKDETSALSVAYIAAILNFAKAKDKTGALDKHLRNTGNMRKFLIDFVATKDNPDDAGFGILDFEQANIPEGLGKLSDNLPKEKRQKPKPRLTEDSTWNDIAESLDKLKSYKGDKIHIVILATPVVNLTIDQCKKTSHGITFDNLSDEKESKVVKNNIGTAVVEYLSTRLKRLTETGEETTKVHITILPIKTNEIDTSIIWPKVGDKLKNVASKTPDIVYISAIGSKPGQGAGIKRNLAPLIANCVVITGAKTQNDKLAPSAFPGESVICAGKRGGPMGSVLDFISSSKQRENKEIERATDEAWVAAADTVCASAAVLIKAKATDPTSYEKLKNTSVMRNVLIRMCTGYPVHHYEEGYGSLQPSIVLDQEDEPFKQLISEIVDENALKVYWSGKTIDY